MKKIVLIIVALFIVGALSVPLVVKKQVDAQIQNNKTILRESGVELDVTKDEGYFSSYREFKLKIVNGRKFRDFVLTRFVEKNPNYKGLTELLQKQSNNDIRPALDGTTFSGNMKNSNLYLTSPLIEISLTKFSDEIMSSIDGHDEVDDLMNSILKDKLFTFFITLDSDQKISQIVMQDIDKNIDDNGKTINVKLKNHKLDIDITKSLKGVYALGEQLISADNFMFDLKGLEYKFDYITQFENSNEIHINSIKFKESSSVVKIGNIDISNSIKASTDETLDADLIYKIKDIYANDNQIFELDRLLFELKVLELDKKGVVNASKAYNELAFNPSQNSINIITNSLQKILNRGFRADLVTSLSGLHFKNMSFDNANFKLNLKVDKNSYTLQSNDIVNALLVNGKLTLDEKNVKDIIKLDRSFIKFAKLGKKEGSKIVFDYEFKDGKLLLNGKKI